MAVMIFARPDGQWFDFPPLEMAAQSGNLLLRPGKADLLPLPEGATLTLMPNAAAVGFDRESGEFLQVDENPYKKKAEPVYAVAALLPQGFTRTLLPAAVCSGEPLPLLGYTAVGVEKGKLVVAALASDEHRRWHPRHFNGANLPMLVEQRQAEFPGNRLISQLSRCSLEYGCFTAQNIIYRRWEGGLPVSPACNAACLGCISERQPGGPPAPQQRITCSPSAEEVAVVAIAHLSQAADAMVSFGQGCEGEPLLAAPLICEAIRLIRAKTRRGLININTNGGDTQAFTGLIAAGLDSASVSLFSAVHADYLAYHRPKNFTLDDVCGSLAAAQEKQVPVALNLLTYPGFSDDEQQVAALIELLGRYDVAQLQLRNLNCDPRLMERFCAGKKPLGIRRMIESLQRELTQLQIGSYSHDLRR
ncbi:MAG: radical SAM protein [Clostridia bacterium]|nr:radical SAM protein [Clostridia bacterium]